MKTHTNWIALAILAAATGSIGVWYSSVLAQGPKTTRTTRIPRSHNVPQPTKEVADSADPLDGQSPGRGLPGMGRVMEMGGMGMAMGMGGMGIGGPGMGMYGGMHIAPTLPEEQSQIVDQYRNASDEVERNELQSSLKAEVEKEFNARQEQRSTELNELRAKLERLELVQQRREKEKSRIIEDRVRQLLSEADGVGWGNSANVEIQQLVPQPTYVP